jgi:hypothetical protein
MIQYLIANAIASFVPTSRVVATKPKPVVRAEKVEVKKANLNLIPLTDVISKNLDARASSVNVSLFAMDFIKRERSGLGFGIVTEANAETGLVSIWNDEDKQGFELSATLHVAGMLSDCIEMNGTTEISFQYSGSANCFNKNIQGILGQINQIWY